MKFMHMKFIYFRLFQAYSLFLNLKFKLSSIFKQICFNYIMNDLEIIDKLIKQ